MAGGEIDLVISVGDSVAAVEVKSRWVTAGGEGDPLDSFDGRKLAQVWSLARHLRPTPTRVDLVAVSFGRDGVGIRWVPAIG